MWAICFSVPKFRAMIGPFLHDTRVLEQIDERCKALTSCIRDLSDLVGVVHVPRFALMFDEKVHDVFGLRKVDECVTNVAQVLEVDAKVAEVVMTETSLVNDGLELMNIHLVGNVAKHNSRTDVLAAHDSADVNWIRVTIRTRSFCETIHHVDAYLCMQTWWCTWKRVVEGNNLLIDHEVW